MAENKNDRLLEDLLAQNLTRAKILERLNAIVDMECSLPKKEQDKELISACIDLQWFLSTGEHYNSNKEDAKKKLDVSLGAKAHTKGYSIHFKKVVYRVAIVASFTIAFVFLPLIGQHVLQRKWITGSTVDDGEIYQLNGNEINPDLVEQAVADTPKEDISISTTNYEEVSHIPGVSQMHPSYTPEDIFCYNYSYTSSNGMIHYIESYQSLDGKETTAYICTVYPEAQVVTNDIEQNQEGVHEIINGIPVYFANNYDMVVATWSNELTSYLISSPLQQEEIRKIIQSIGVD